MQGYAMVVTSSPLVRTYTLDEFWELPEPPDRSKLELIAGVLYMSPPPSDYHGDVVARINRALTGHLLATADEGMLYVPRAAVWTRRHRRHTYLEPDLYYVTKERRERRAGPYEAADLVVEVISPGSAVYDRTAKADTYGALGVRELWLVDPDARMIEVRIFSDGGVEFRTFEAGDTLVSSVLPALSFAVRDVFAPFP